MLTVTDDRNHMCHDLITRIHRDVDFLAQSILKLKKLIEQFKMAVPIQNMCVLSKA
jgi:hypothetical protein